MPQVPARVVQSLVQDPACLIQTPVSSVEHPVYVSYLLFSMSVSISSICVSHFQSQIYIPNVLSMFYISACSTSFIVFFIFHLDLSSLFHILLFTFFHILHSIINFILFILLFSCLVFKAK